MRACTCEELGVKHNQTSCYLRPPFLGTLLGVRIFQENDVPGKCAGYNTLKKTMQTNTHLHPRSHQGQYAASLIWSSDCAHPIREMGGAPRNPAPRNHLLVWIVKSPGCHCTDAFGGKQYRRVPTPLRSTSPLNDPTCPTPQ